MIGIIVWLVVGGIVGWLASLVMRTDAQQGLLLNVVVGIVGAFIGAWLLPRIGLGFGGGVLWWIIDSTIGAVVLLVIIGLFRR